MGESRSPVISGLLQCAEETHPPDGSRSGKSLGDDLINRGDLTGS